MWPTVYSGTGQHFPGVRFPCTIHLTSSLHQTMQNPKNFAVTGVAGFVAPRHLNAIESCGHRLVAAVDPHDSVGLLDQFSYEVQYFRQYEAFVDYLGEMSHRGESERIHYVSICAPNHLHDLQIRSALNVGANVICEKPLVLDARSLESLKGLEQSTHCRIFTVLQLRLHPSILKLKEKVDNSNQIRKYDVDLTYIASRGRWYLDSWKGNQELSGGLATNIGIHFFDALIWIFGNIERYEVRIHEPTKMSGILELEHAIVQWFLSIDPNDLPSFSQTQNRQTYRSLTCDSQEIEFSEGFTDLHTEVYKDILSGGGFGIDDVQASIELTSGIRSQISI